MKKLNDFDKSPSNSNKIVTTSKVYLLLIIIFIQLFSNSMFAQIISFKNSIKTPVQNHSIFAIWPCNSEGIDTTIQEKEEPRGNRYYNIFNPNMEFFKADNPNGTALVLCAGGGYGYIATGVEGTPVAEKLNRNGISVFVLKYRLPNTKNANFKHPVPLSDALRAIQFVRYNAKQFEIDKEKIGIMGFSAGGHLAALAGTLYLKYNFGSDEISEENSRPNFMCLVYPVISIDQKIGRASFYSLVNDTNNVDLLNELSCEKNVSENTPATFIVYAKDDNAVNPWNSKLFYNALVTNNIPALIKGYEHGQHGFGIGRPGTDSENWTDDFLEWLSKSNYK